MSEKVQKNRISSSVNSPEGIVDMARESGEKMRNHEAQRVQLVFTNKTYNITHYGLVA